MNTYKNYENFYYDNLELPLNAISMYSLTFSKSKPLIKLMQDCKILLFQKLKNFIEAAIYNAKTFVTTGLL